METADRDSFHAAAESSTIVNLNFVRIFRLSYLTTWQILKNTSLCVIVKHLESQRSKMDVTHLLFCFRIDGQIAM